MERNSTNSYGFFNCISVIISIVFGAAVGVLFGFGFISNIVTAIWIALVFSALVLFSLVLIILSDAYARSENLRFIICKNITILLIAVFVTFLLAIIALSITLITGDILTAIFIGISAFFFMFLVLLVANLIRCITYSIY